MSCRAVPVGHARPAHSPERFPQGISVIIPAAGAGKRLGSPVPKAFVRIASRPLSAHTVLRLAAAVVLDQIIVAAPRGWVRRCRAMLAPVMPEGAQFVTLSGGATRTDSVRRALAALDARAEIVMIHDAARPFVPVAAVQEAVSEAARGGAAVVGIPVTDTIKEADGRGRVVRTPDRNALWQIQTPQVFRRELIERAYRRAGARATATDDSVLVERLGARVKLIPGSAENFKVTTPLDLRFARALLEGS